MTSYKIHVKYNGYVKENIHVNGGFHIYTQCIKIQILHVQVQNGTFMRNRCIIKDEMGQLV